jgi:hypothetical protein
MIFRLASLVVLSSIALPQWTGAVPASASSAHKYAVRGYLVDLVCLKEEAGKFPDFSPDHTKKCLQMPVCARGGYAILLSSKEVLPFDDHGNDLARKLIAARSQEKGFVVRATGTHQGNLFHVLRIE